MQKKIYKETIELPENKHWLIVYIRWLIKKISILKFTYYLLKYIIFMLINIRSCVYYKNILCLIMRIRIKKNNYKILNSWYYLQIL